MSQSMRLMNDDSGQSLVLTSLCLLVLVGFVGLGIDVGLLYQQRRQVQLAADNAALAAAAGESLGVSATTSANTAVTQNGLSLGSGINQATVAATDSIAGTGNTNYVDVVVTKKVPTIFMGLLNSRFGQLSITAFAQASYRVASNQSCITALSKTGIMDSSMYPRMQADIIVVGNAQISTPNCGVCGNSDGAGGVGVYASQSGRILTLSLDSQGGACGVYGSGDICSNQGGRIANPNNTGAPATQTNAACVDPYAGTMPTITPGSTIGTGTLPWTPPNGGGRSYTINPGTYNNFDLSNVATLTMNPGLYIFTGTFNSGGGTTINGNGVTLYFAPGSSLLGYSYGGNCNCGIQNNTTLNISAPNNPATISQGIKGVVIYDGATPSARDTFEFGGGSNSQVTGTVYAPNTNLLLGNGTSTQSLSANIIASTVRVIGGSSFTDSYTPASGGSATTGGVTLTQ